MGIRDQALGAASALCLMPSASPAFLLCVGFDGLAVTPALREIIARGVRNVILFARNFVDRTQLSELCHEVKALAPAGESILICVDHEGGRVQRFLTGFTRVPPMRDIGRIAEEDELEPAEHQVRSLGRLIAGELRSCGIDLNLAPVLDVDSNPANPVIGERSFGRDQHLVARLGVDMIESMQSTPHSIAACGKHFPGHGDTSNDSHFDLPRLPHDLKRLREIELVPFAAAISAGVACIMPAHVMFDALDRDAPATMSQRVVDGLLRTELGFEGVVITDDLEMKAIADHFGVVDGAVRACAAGADMLMCCHTPQRQHAIIDALDKAFQDGRLPPQRIEESVRRIKALHGRFVR